MWGIRITIFLRCKAWRFLRLRAQGVYFRFLRGTYADIDTNTATLFCPDLI